MKTRILSLLFLVSSVVCLVGQGPVAPRLAPVRLPNLSMFNSLEVAEVYAANQIKKVTLQVDAPSMIYGTNRTRLNRGYTPGSLGARLDEIHALVGSGELDIELVYSRNEVEAITDYWMEFKYPKGSVSYSVYQGRQKFRLVQTPNGWQVPAWAQRIQVDYMNLDIMIPVDGNFHSGSVMTEEGETPLNTETFGEGDEATRWLRIPLGYAAKEGVSFVLYYNQGGDWPTGFTFDSRGNRIESPKAASRFYATSNDRWTFVNVSEVLITPMSEYSPMACISYTQPFPRVSIRATAEVGRITEEATAATLVVVGNDVEGKQAIFTQRVALPWETHADSPVTFWIVDIEWPTPRKQRERPALPVTVPAFDTDTGMPIPATPHP